EIMEGSFPLGMNADDIFLMERADNWISAANPRTKHLLFSWYLAGYNKSEVLEPKDSAGSSKINLVYPRSAVIQFTATMNANPFTLKTLHYASPKPMDATKIRETAANLINKWS